MTRPLVVVVDTGLDDALALAWCATNPGIELVAAIATFGNTSRDQAFANTRLVLDALGAPEVDVFSGAAVPMGDAPPAPPVALLMGQDGLGGAGATIDAGAVAAARRGDAALAELAGQHDGDLEVLALAPLTTVAAALTLDPELPAKIAQLTVMGGAVSVGGMTTAAAEPNIANDPVAAAAVADAFASAGDRPPRLVPTDVTRTITGPSDADALLGAARALPPLLTQAWANAWALAAHESLDGSGPCLHDLLAAVALTDDAVLDWTRLPLAVDCARSAGWGATVADRRAVLFDAAPLDAETKAGFAAMMGMGPNRWEVALTGDRQRFVAALKQWWSA